MEEKEARAIINLHDHTAKINLAADRFLAEPSHKAAKIFFRAVSTVSTRTHIDNLVDRYTFELFNENLREKLSSWIVIMLIWGSNHDDVELAQMTPLIIETGEWIKNLEEEAVNYLLTATREGEYVSV